MILFWTQSLLGIGHWQRTRQLMLACQDIGLPVVLAHGAPLPAEVAFEGMPRIALPPCFASDVDAKQLVDERGAALSAAWWQQRSDALVRAIDDQQPRLLVTELFPFGRWQFRKELLPVFEHLRTKQPQTRLVASVRDILPQGASRPERAAKITTIVNEHYESILVHSDPDLISLKATFPFTDKINVPLHYTGFVSANAAYDHEHPVIERQPVVIVSAGGGRFGEKLLSAAIEAWPHSRYARHVLWLVAGSHFPPQAYATLQQRCEDKNNVRLFNSYPQLASALATARLSISQGGYNTTLEVLGSGTLAIIVPFADGAQVEQTQRTRLLADKGLCLMLPEEQLTPQSLSDAMHSVQPPSHGTHLHTGGAAVSAAILEKLHRAH